MQCSTATAIDFQHVISVSDETIFVSLSGPQDPAKWRAIAAANSVIVECEGWIDGSRPNLFAVAVVISPRQAIVSPFNFSLRSFVSNNRARFLTVDELVKAIQSAPPVSIALNLPRSRSVGITF